jgi:3-oxoacyl-[acyl-carrier protein] reductase
VSDGLGLRGRVAVVTGAGEGIGRDIAAHLVKAGARVVLNDVDAARAGEAAAAIRVTGGACVPVPGDAGDPAFAAELVAAAVREFGRLDVAVANAGLSLVSAFLETTPAEFDRLVGLNLRGSYFLAQAAARQMRAQGQGGSVLFMSSVCGHLAVVPMAAYGMTKAGLEMLARALVPELGPLGVRVNAVAPGATLTPRTIALEPGYDAWWGAKIPLGRVATTADIARVALFLLSDGAAHVTGQTLVVDGGWTSIGDVPRPR